MKRLRPTVAAVSVALATTTFGVFTSSAAQAADGVCANPNDVTVVVDFQELGGGVNVRCAPGPVATGFDALQRAGISYQTTIRFAGFLCKIAGRPSNDPCIDASPASAYWSYWIAARGGQWCYSNWGAGNRRPPPGTVEAWSFSKDRTGSTSPPPRTGVPAPIPGVAPTPLAGNDCDANRPAPGPPVTAPALTSPPAPAPVPAPPSASGGAQAGGLGGPAGGSVGTDPGTVPGGAPSQPGGTAGTPATPTTPPGDAVATTVPETSPGAVGNAVDPAAGSDETDVKSESEPRAPDAGQKDSDSSEDAAGSVDLSSNGTSPSSTPVGVGLALALVTAMGVGTYFRTRRRRAEAE